MKGFFPARFIKLREFKEFLILTSHAGYGTSSEISLDSIIYLLSIGGGLVGRAGFFCLRGMELGVWFRVFFPESNLL